MKRIVMIVTTGIILSFFAGCDQKAKSKDFISEEQIESAIKQSDDFPKYKVLFISATKGLVEEGMCTISELNDMGGWVKSQNHKYEPVYFTYCGGMRQSNKIYLNAITGKVFR